MLLHSVNSTVATMITNGRWVRSEKIWTVIQTNIFTIFAEIAW